jgi:four helix bundle suffix protein
MDHMDDMDGMDGVVSAHGGYRGLKSFQLAQLCYDLTTRFCSRYVNPKSRTFDLMVQAARSGVQNIAESSKASGTSKKTEIKLTNVARASLEELRLDYEDYLRQRGLKLWPHEDPRRRQLIARRCTTAEEVSSWVSQLHGRDGHDGRYGRSDELAANAALVLIGVACALLDRQIAAQAKAFETEGGFTERLYRVSTQHRAHP